MITVDFNKIDLSPGSRVLDVGCGSGRHLAEAVRRPGVTVVGTDLNWDDLIQAEDRLRFHRQVGEHGGGTSLLMLGDAGRLPLADQSFDVVICSEVLEHIPQDGAAFGELVRVLKPGGDLVVSVPRFWPEKICWTLSPEYRQAKGGHVRIYRKNRLIDLAEKNELTHWACHFAHALHSPFWWLKCLIGPDRDAHPFIRLYHRFLVWDMMSHPAITRLLERILNPVLGKSLVLYFKKE